MSLNVTTKVSESDKHEWDINHLLYHKGKLYSGSDDGKIKVWSSDLKLLGETQAHPCSVYCLAASDKELYSCSNEGTIKSWDPESLKEIKTIINDPEVEFWRVGYAKGMLISGDQTGNIKVFKDDKFYGSFDLAEPVKDMIIDDSRDDIIIFSSNILDVIVTEIKTEGKIQYGSKVTIQAKSPLALSGDKICFTSREGKDIIVHENSIENAFKPVAVAKGASDLLINSLAGAKWEGHSVLFSGGWAKNVKKWKIENNDVKAEASVDVGFVVNYMTVGEKGQVFVGGEDGNLVRIDVK